MKKRIEKIFNDSIQIKQKTLEMNLDNIAAASSAIRKSLRQKRKVLLFGNGGSAADCQHIAAELVGRFKKERKAMAAIALTTDTSILTSVGNDYGYEYAYQKFLEYYVEKGTLVIIMSSGGESSNMYHCLDWCEGNNISYGVLTGFDMNNRTRSQARNALWNYYINSKSYGVVESCHQIFLHGVI